MSESGNDTLLENVNEDVDSHDESYFTCRGETTYLENNNDSIEGDEDGQNSTIGGGDTNDSVLDNSTSIDDREDIHSNLEEKSCDDKSLGSPCEDRSLASPREEQSITSPHEEQSITSPREERSVASSREERSIASPYEERSIASPYEERSIASPYEERSIASPYEKQSIASPYEEKSIASPYEEKSIASPYEEQSIASPYEEQSIASPYEERNISSPYEEQNISSPCEDKGIGSPCEDKSVSSPNEDKSIASPYEGNSLASPCERKSITSPFDEKNVESPSCQVVENDKDENVTHQNEENYGKNDGNRGCVDHSEDDCRESNVKENDQLNISIDSGNDKEESHHILSPEHTNQHAKHQKENEDDCIYDDANIPENEVNSLSLDDERNTEHRTNDKEKENNSHNSSKHQNSNNNKRRSDEGLEIRDELDFEEEKEESAEEGEESEGEKETEINKEPINKEEGELTDEDYEEALLRQEPKTVCRFFNKGQCTWGTNCRFLHPGVSDKGNYNMFAAAKPPSQEKEEENNVDKERPREVRRYVPEPVGFESAWERGLRHAKEMMKRANKRKETDADFEEKRFNLSLGQAELDRENDYYTRPASPVYKPSDEVIEYLDPYEKQAIRHFRGGHFENFEVRYKVDQSNYPNRGGPEHIRSRRDKFEREVTERVPMRKMRAASPVIIEKHKPVKEKRYPRPTYGKDDRSQETPAVGKEAEVWADPWARRRTPVKRAKKVSRNRSYSSGSSSGSSRSSRSSSYSSYSRSGSRSSSRSRSSRSSSRSITPPVHPRQQRATMNRGGMRGGRGRGFDRGGGRGGGPPRNFYHPHQQYSQPPNPPPNHPLAPDVNFLRQNQMGPPGPGFPPNRRGRGRDDNRFANFRHQNVRNLHPAPNDNRVPPMQFKQEPRDKNPEPKEKTIPIQRNPNPKQNQPDIKERVDMFGRTIRKDVVRSPSKSPKRHPPKPHGRRRFSLSPSKSRSGSGSSSSSGSSGSRSRSRSSSGSRSGSHSSKSRSRSRSSSGSSVSPTRSPLNKKKIVEKVERVRKPAAPPAPPPTGVVSYGDSNKSKAIDIVKVAGQKQAIKLTLKKPGPMKQIDRAVLDVDDDSGESDTDARILKKRKIDVPPVNPPPAKKPRAPSPTAIASLTTGTIGIKKPSAARREELLKQLRAVEDAIARKRSKPL